MRKSCPILMSIGLTLALGACQEQEAEVPAPVRPVLTVIAAPERVQQQGFVGTVEPQVRSSLGFRVLGRIVSRSASVGESVEKGAQLAGLDPLAFELAVRSAQADLSTAQAQWETTRATEARQRTLLEQNATTQAEFEAAQQARAAAEATVAQARANLVKAREQLGYTQLRADYAGVVTAVEAEIGQVVQPGETVVTLARPDLREVVVDLPEGIAAELQPGSRFDVALQLAPTVRAGGEVREIAPQADPATRTRRVRITLADPPDGFRLGTTVTAYPMAETALGIELPASALLERDGRTLVWVVNPATNTVSTREVQVSARNGQTIRVTGGLAPGDRAVTAGVNSLAPGQSVKILDEASS
ncbi:efflux RND transporter periplasmic adaptor subunit [Microvirga arsenatis]|uniref:Efflux RND transporter periplasmic adaptor subunit n=1 Tax=Microvirga arsenatis TaxID=2692265 RepID=A0ABW9Z6I7_9HYPH|nr:efflux RND transporter periplasmic adaptor subunit [Microvirga arsenatis]NBJ13848.1 efflux RND transporter periplasmic adaptor subunit [Microvirga arsenatis]NBJ27310.1 efflux RND transporter periplasmic adaptor subunit [Microvirga arsenatis]